MVENSQAQKRGQKRKEEQTQFDQRYLGLSRAEVSLREKMAKKFGRQAQHLDAKSQSQPAEEESKGAQPQTNKSSSLDLDQAHVVSQKSLLLNQQPRNDNNKLRQLQMDNELYRANMESGHQLLKAKSEQVGPQLQSAASA